jgi:hypothetical protein
MKIFASFVFLFVSSSYAACDFAPAAKSVYSLSGPMTQLIERVGILSSPVVQGVSIFYPAPDSFKGEKIPGGVFLSPAKLNEMRKSIVFFDESQELRKLFRSQKINAVEVRSRNMIPGQVVKNSIHILKNYVQGCTEKFGMISERVSLLEKKIVQSMKIKRDIVFFLGAVGEGKLPDLVIAHDGIVLWLKKMNLINTYPSDLAYVSWSSSLINRLKDKYLFVGLKEEKRLQVIGNSSRATLIYPGCLIPGISQLEAWLYFLQHIPR